MRSKITRRLLDEVQERNLKLVLPHLLVLIFISYYLKAVNGISFLTSGVGLVLFLRFLLIKHFSKKTTFTARNFELCFAVTVGAVGFLWGAIFLQTVSHFGLFDVRTLVILGSIFTLLTGGITAFSASRIIVITHLVSLSVLPILKLFFMAESEYLGLALLMVVNLFYQIYHATMANKLLKNSFRNELMALSQKETIQQFIDAIPGLVVVLDDEKNYLMVNNYSDGFFKDKINGKKLGELFPYSGLVSVIREFYASDDDSLVKEVKSLDLGVENWFMVNLRKMTHPKAGVIASILPINELVQAKNDLKIQEARSKYAAKLASLGELSAGIAHEVNNPLTIIEGAASLMKVILKDEVIDRPALEKAAVKISDTSQRIARIVKSLKTLSGNAEEEPYQNIKFSSILEPCLEISKGKLIQHDIKLAVKGQESDVELFGNEIQLSQVLMNLVANAIDAVKDLGEDKHIEIIYEPSFEWIDILVRDNGRGVPREIRDKIMEPFFTTKESNQGTGLGLSISRSIVQSHEGSLALLDEGPTTFRVRLPRMTPWNSRKKPLEGKLAVP